MANEDISVTLTGTPEEKRYALDTIRQDMGGPTANQMARFTPTSPQIESTFDARQKEIGALDERLGPLRQNVDQAVSGVQQAGAQAMPPVPTLQPTPKYIPKELSQETMVNFGSLAMAFAALAGMRTRQPLTAAMNAAGAAMNGFSQGNITQVKQDLEVFKAQSESALASNRQMLQQYESILSNRRLTFAEKMAEYRMAADRYGDEISKTFLKVGSIDKLMQFYQHQLDAQNRFQQHVEDMNSRYSIAMAQIAATNANSQSNRDLRADLMEGQGWSIMAGTDGKMYRVNARTGQQIPMDGPQMLPPGKGGAGRPLPAKAAEDISGRGTIISLLDNLIAVQKAEIAKGGGFGGYGFDMIGNAVIKGGRALGENTPEALFFSQLETIAQPDRHELFGATLTGGERESWRQGWVGAGDNPKTLLAVMEQKRDIYRQMAQSKMNAYASMGFNVGPSGGQPSAQPSTSKYQEGQTATGPNGQKLIFRGGSWQPMQ